MSDRIDAKAAGRFQEIIGVLMGHDFTPREDSPVGETWAQRDDLRAVVDDANTVTIHSLSASGVVDWSISISGTTPLSLLDATIRAARTPGRTDTR